MLHCGIAMDLDAFGMFHPQKQLEVTILHNTSHTLLDVLSRLASIRHDGEALLT